MMLGEDKGAFISTICTSLWLYSDVGDRLEKLQLIMDKDGFEAVVIVFDGEEHTIDANGKDCIQLMGEISELLGGTS